MNLLTTLGEALAVTKTVTGSENLTLARAIKAAVMRNKKDQQHLFVDGLQLGVDYLMCPLTGMRKTVMKESHFTKLGFSSFADALKMFPELVTSLPSMVDNRVKAQSAVIDGKSSRQLAEEKRRASRSTIGEDGLTVDQRAGEKGKHTKETTCDAYGIPLSKKNQGAARIKQLHTLGSNRNLTVSAMFTAFAEWLNSNNNHHKVIAPSACYGKKLSPWICSSPKNKVLGETAESVILDYQGENSLEFSALVDLMEQSIESNSNPSSEEILIAMWEIKNIRIPFPS